MQIVVAVFDLVLLLSLLSVMMFLFMLVLQGIVEIWRSIRDGDE